MCQDSGVWPLLHPQRLCCETGAGFADEAKRTQLKQLVEGGKFKVKFATYNWDVNK